MQLLKEPIRNKFTINPVFTTMKDFQRDFLINHFFHQSQKPFCKYVIGTDIKVFDTLVDFEGFRKLVYGVFSIFIVLN